MLKMDSEFFRKFSKLSRRACGRKLRDNKAEINLIGEYGGNIFRIQFRSYHKVPKYFGLIKRNIRMIRMWFQIFILYYDITIKQYVSGNQSKQLAFIMHALSEKYDKCKKIQFKLLQFYTIRTFADYSISVATSETFDRPRYESGGICAPSKWDLSSPGLSIGADENGGSARSLARERAPSSITLPRIWKFHPRNALNAFTCPNFRWQSAVHVHTSACRECSQFVGIFSSVRRPTHRSSLHGCSNCRFDPGHLFSTPCPWSFPPEITARLEAVFHEHALGYI